MASAVTAAVAMGLDQEQIGNALALAMDMASGTEQYVWDAGYCDTKDLLAGLGARNGHIRSAPGGIRLSGTARRAGRRLRLLPRLRPGL